MGEPGYKRISDMVPQTRVAARLHRENEKQVLRQLRKTIEAGGGGPGSVGGTGAAGAGGGSVAGVRAGSKAGGGTGMEARASPLTKDGFNKLVRQQSQNL